MELLFDLMAGAAFKNCVRFPHELCAHRKLQSYITF